MDCLDELFELLNHRIHFLLCIMFTKREANCYQVGVIIDSSYNMRTHIRSTTAGAAARDTDIIDIEIEEDEADDLMRTVELQLRQRRFGFGVRLEVAEGMSPQMVELLAKSLDLGPQDVYPVAGPLHIPDLMALHRLEFPDLKDKPYTPTVPNAFRQSETIFDSIRHQDVLLHHPFESFGPVIEFIRSAATDPKVLAIKLTLYRVGPNSPIVQALIDAAERGKQVAVLTDARFSGVSTGACIGHIGPEALAGGPVGKVLDGDCIEITVDRNNLVGTINLIGEGETVYGAEEGTRILASRQPRPDLAPDSDLPDDTRLWAALQNACGGTWGGCVYDVDMLVNRLSGSAG